MADFLYNVLIKIINYFDRLFIKNNEGERFLYFLFFVNYVVSTTVCLLFVSFIFVTKILCIFYSLTAIVSAEGFLQFWLISIVGMAVGWYPLLV